jgi:hypothetical protein
MLEEIASISTSDVCPKNDMDKKCAPGVNFESGSCISLQILIEMAIAYNKDAGSDSIKLQPKLDTLNPKKYKKYLLGEFNKKMGDKCTSQKCWSEQTFVSQMKKTMRDELEKYTFRPDGPEGKFEWLNTLNIDDVMEQSEKTCKDFKFLGTVPIDFDKFDRFKIRNLNYNQLVSEGKTKLGVVFNLDEHDQSGSHWVAMYSNLKKGEIYFFDSYGTRPERRIRALMRRLAKFCKDELKLKHIIVDYNKVRHQYKNSECGVYSINFIKRMLRGDSFETICNSKIPDDKINRCRNVYFRNEV